MCLIKLGKEFCNKVASRHIWNGGTAPAFDFPDCSAISINWGGGY